MQTLVDERRYRVWIVSCEGWRPQSVSDVPAHAVAVEPAEETPMSAEEAGIYVESFNATALAEPSGHWAVAVPLQVRYEGDLAAGEEFNYSGPGSSITVKLR